MKNFFEIITDDTWYRQFVYGTALAAFSGLICLFCGWSLLIAVAWTVMMAGFREHYLEDITGQFNWRNFLFLIVPVLVLYIIFNN